MYRSGARFQFFNGVIAINRIEYLISGSPEHVRNKIPNSGLIVNYQDHEISWIKARHRNSSIEIRESQMIRDVCRFPL